ncbi:hypothetical protein TWF506_003581 [Arthrobotrys conoides]|uniref:Chitinase n=1 Tax=Arthrobotrys conoides TaxID=74498 RepID=A0AAN8N2F5_9PEZI
MATWNSTNGAWLPGIWDSPEDLTTSLDFMRDHNIEYIFPTTKTLTKEGGFAINTNFIIYLHQFMLTIKEYEESTRSCGKKFKIIPVVEACFDKEKTNEYLDLNNPEIHAAAVANIRRFVVADIENSFVTGMPRPFDGVQFSVRNEEDVYDFEVLKKFMREVKSATGKITSLAVPKFGGSWASSRFYYAALYVDILAPMCFNSSAQTAEEYQSFMKDQVHNILRAVSGKYTNNHGRPWNGVKVLFGFPCFPDSGEETKVHNSIAENIATAAQGAIDGVKKLVEENDDSLEFAAGASLYMFSDGKGKDGYSTKADMDDFGKYWAFEKHDVPVDKPKEDGPKEGDPKEGTPDNSSNTPLVKVVVAAILLVCAWIIAVG